MAEYDKAQLDYDKIFREVLRICPNMTTTIDYIKGIRPAGRGEYNSLFNIIFNDGEGKEKAKSRLFDTNLRSAVKMALYAYQKQGIDLEDAFQTFCIGLNTAISKYNRSVKGPFPAYASWYMQRELSRSYSDYYYNVYVPPRLFESMNTVIRILRKKFNITDFGTIDFDVLYGMVSECSDNESWSFEMAFLIYKAVSLPISIDEITDRENMNADVPYTEHLCSRLYVSDEQCLESIFDDAARKKLHSAVNEALSTLLSPKEVTVLCHRFGINGFKRLSLREIGNLIDTKREYVRRIEAKALWKLQKNRYNELKEYLTISSLYQ